MEPVPAVGKYLDSGHAESAFIGANSLPGRNRDFGQP